MLRSCLVVLFLLASGLAASETDVAQSPPEQDKPKPTLTEVAMIGYGLDPNRMTRIDISNGKLCAVAEGLGWENDALEEKLRKRAGPGYHVFLITAKVSKEDLAGLQALVEASGLRDFETSPSHIKVRERWIDECAPDLALIWSDKKRVFALPLHNTVKADAPDDAKRAYAGMSELCDRLWDLDVKYGSHRALRMLSVHGREYASFMEEGRRLLDPDLHE